MGMTKTEAVRIALGDRDPNEEGRWVIRAGNGTPDWFTEARVVAVVQGTLQQALEFAVSTDCWRYFRGRFGTRPGTVTRWTPPAVIDLNEDLS